MKRLYLVLFCAFILSTTTLTANNIATSFYPKETSYDTLRIPAMIAAKDGNVLLFCEGRKNSSSDTGVIDIIMNNWSPKTQKWEGWKKIVSNSKDTFGNPCPVVLDNGTIFLPFCWNSGKISEKDILAGKGERKVYVISSKNSGKTWSKMQEITKSVKKDNWTWYATGPGNSIQIKHGKNKGRIIVPCNHALLSNKNYYSHIFYSDDSGATWKLGGSVDIKNTNECVAVELSEPEGAILLNMRNQNKPFLFFPHHRKLAVSKDGGLSWKAKKPFFWDRLISPKCEGSSIRYSWPGSATGNIILYSGPMSSHSREKMTIRYSKDNCSSWKILEKVTKDTSAYSSLTKLPNGNILCAYESGKGYKCIKVVELSSENFNIKAL